MGKIPVFYQYLISIIIILNICITQKNDRIPNFTRRNSTFRILRVQINFLKTV